MQISPPKKQPAAMVKPQMKLSIPKGLIKNMNKGPTSSEIRHSTNKRIAVSGLMSDDNSMIMEQKRSRASHNNTISFQQSLRNRLGGGGHDPTSMTKEMHPDSLSTTGGMND